jgi:hypothetical protein
LKSFTDSTEAFLKVATYLGTEDEPMVTALRQVAAELDASDSIVVGLVKEYGVIYRTLMKKAGKQEAPKTDKQAFLQGL